MSASAIAEKTIGHRASMMVAIVIGAVSLAAWLYLIFARGGFWRASAGEDEDQSPTPAQWPHVVAVVPARNEADVLPETLTSLLAQDYPGRFDIVLVDDQSDDGTAEVARSLAARAPGGPALTVVQGTPVSSGWAGKLWAVRQGIENASADDPHYLLLTDADIAYRPGALAHLVRHALARNLVLTSRMVALNCESAAERALVPAFVFFFAMLYPFAWVNDPARATAAAAGGCMLVERTALARAGGIEAIRGALIDDCALARALKAVGPIWLGLTKAVRSRRRYPTFDDIRRMVSRSAYDQLGYSPLLLAGTVAGMLVVYVAPPVLAVFADGPARILGLAAWLAMAAAYQPILRFYDRSPAWGLALPAIGATYVAFTLDSAYQYLRGRGGTWKGRVQAGVSGPR